MNGLKTNILANIGDLQVIYEECNEHLREVDRKRDQILAFFIAFLGIVIGNSDRILSAYENKVLLLKVIHVFFFVGGILLTDVLLEYRLWHVKYVLSAQVIQKLMFMSKNIANKSDIDAILKKTMYKPCRKKLIHSVESMILNIFMIINLINIAYIVTISNNIIYGIVTVSIIGIVYILYFNEKNYQNIKRFYESIQKDSANIWILDLIYPELDNEKDEVVYSNNYYDVQVKKNILKLYDKLGGVVIVPVTVDGKFILIEVERQLTNEISLEFPRGFMEKEESLINAAQRELQEEIGVNAMKYEYIGYLAPNNGLLSSKVAVVLAEGIKASGIRLQEQEKIIGIRYVDYSDLKKLAKQEITDGFTLSSIIKVKDRVEIK